MNFGNKQNISILVPCYNVENFLPKFFESLLQQDLKDIILIFCNDASTDNTLQKLRLFKFLNSNLNIEILENPFNVGLAETRNKLIDAVQTSHFFFIDPDDTLINKQAFSEFKDLIDMYPETDLFVSKGKVQLNIPRMNFILRHIRFNNPLLNNVELKKSGFIDPKEYISLNHPFAWNVLVKTKFFKDLGVRYLKNHVMEDFSVGYYMFFMANKCYFINKYNHLYYCHQKSITFTVNFKKVDDLAANIEFLYNMLEKEGLLDPFIFDYDIEQMFMKRMIFGLTYKNLYGKHLKNAKYYSDYFMRMQNVLNNWGITKRLSNRSDFKAFAKYLNKFNKTSEKIISIAESQQQNQMIQTQHNYDVAKNENKY